MTDHLHDYDAGGGGRPLRRAARRPVFGAVVVLLATLAAGILTIWVQRQPIAEHFVQRELRSRGVRASYRVSQIALRTQRIENLVLGDPARPDLTARSVEIDIAYGGIVPTVGAVRARGVRLYGRVTNKGLLLGELDKFRDPASTAPFGMPDIDLTLDDARARIDTPAGPLAIAIDGSGNLQSGFRGKVAALGRGAAIGGCFIPQASAWLDVRMVARVPRLSGPVRADALRCADGTAGLAGLAVRADVTLAPDLTRWSGTVRGGASAARAAGVTVARPGLDMRFDGTAQRTGGSGVLSARALRYGAAIAGFGEVRGRWRLAGDRVGAQGRLAVRDVHGLAAGALRNASRTADGSPVGPLLARLAGAVAALEADNALHGSFALDGSAGQQELRFEDLQLAGGKGGRIGLGDDSRFALSLPDGRWALNGAITSEGGGLPRLALRLRQVLGGGFSGQMFMDPYQAAGARIEVDPVRIGARPDGVTRLTTRLRLDGPMPDGRLSGFTMPLTAEWGRAGLTVNRDCAPVQTASLRLGAFLAGPLRLRACPVDGGFFVLRDGKAGGGVSLDSPRLAGRIGSTLMQVAARSVRYRIGAGRFELAGAETRLGSSEAPVLLSAEALEGGATAGGIGGRASGIVARIGAVPLLVRDGAARWSFGNGVLVLGGSLVVHDDANPDRFNPMMSPDFRLRLADNRIDASGSLRLPGRERTVATVRLWHLLGTGAGHADLAVDALRFDNQLQPDEVTHIALGVVANVEGVVNGAGIIDWTPQRVTSSGEFSTEGTNLAAAFGPVQGLSTRIRFTDLLGLVTAPGQEMRLKSINPGIEVREGIIRYALAPGQRVAIEGGRWPFAGGELTLLPTVMDMSAEQPRRLIFRVVGLDAGAFIQTLELENVSATGTFDGLLPMVFDASGGRIVGGILTARQSGMPPLVIDHVEGLNIPCDSRRQGGRLSYVGQVSNENLGTYGKLAFDALKDLQYKCLTIAMDGAIDGEVVTQVMFNGVNRGELSTVPKAVASQFVGLPFVFNITIAAPFRGLINTARSYVDPSLVIRQYLDNRLKSDGQSGLAVQPRESETMPTGERR